MLRPLCGLLQLLFGMLQPLTTIPTCEGTDADEELRTEQNSKIPDVLPCSLQKKEKKKGTEQSGARIRRPGKIIYVHSVHPYVAQEMFYLCVSTKVEHFWCVTLDNINSCVLNILEVIPHVLVHNLQFLTKMPSQTRV